MKKVWKSKQRVHLDRARNTGFQNSRGIIAEKPHER